MTQVVQTDGGVLRKHQVYAIFYRCETPGPAIEEGAVEGFWTGDIDWTGKLTIHSLRGEILYLFQSEITDIVGV